MKYFFIILSTLFIMANAQEYKAVFNCNAKDMQYVASRMILVERTMDMIEKNGDTTKFAITIHGGCAPIVSKNYDEIVLDEKDLESIKASQQQLIKLSEKGVEVVVCAMSLNANTIPKEDVIPEVKISQNSFIDTIRFQNNGYALMVFE
ncbi:DsrE family protein [Sulfurimonas sp.]|uniref:DsrE family protein n=1 Tax=Sulfurimonas sp. TaxID=2022749 RepID=UPI0025D2DBA9|nr:DsrE family protein [Sulfurimonas sp.]MCK9473529.1 DsrE family protein [Sulfurimonas sp.]MDD3505370.1 DsrE family protein [Sulfurimonas sp.]